MEVVSPWEFLLWPHNNKELGPEVSTNETKYMFMSEYYNTGQNNNMRFADKSFSNMAEFKYFGMK
jgi:hypothetical protein